MDPLNGGIIAFVSNGSWIDGNSANGFRKCLEKEFTTIYILNLRGNARTQGELRRKEAGNVFGGGSRTPITITLLVKNPIIKNKTATIFYHEIEDYLSKEEKLNYVKKYGSICNSDMIWNLLQTNEHADWISKRNDLFETFIPLGDKENKKNLLTVFVPFYSNGLKTQRDAWCYNSLKTKLEANIENIISFYNEQQLAFHQAKATNFDLEVKSFVNYDSSKISWTRALEWDVEKGKKHRVDSGNIVTALYRPFFKQHLYFARSLNEMVYQIPKLFPNPNINNLVICVTGNGTGKAFSALISNCIPDIQLQFNGQCFPLYYFEEQQKLTPGLFEAVGESEYIRRDGITDFIFKRAASIYGNNLNKEDVFYYVYGFLHNDDYRKVFKDDLNKMLPRLPMVEDVRDFWKFSKAGRELAELHINYESVPAYEGVNVAGAIESQPS